MHDVTVLMAVYNSAAYLRPAIDSVLAQTHPNFELLIVDDASTDGTVSICRSYADARLRLITHPSNRGLAEALNTGLAETRTELVARLDPDDVAEPHRLQRQREVMLAQPDLALLGSQAVAMTPEGVATGTVRRSLEPASILWSSIFGNPFVHPTVMFRASVVRELGGFRTEYDPFAQDYELWCRVMERHSVANLPDRLVRHRVHGSSIMGFQARPDAAPSPDQRFATIMRTLTTRHARRIFGDAVLPDEKARLVAGLILGLDAADLDPFLELFEQLLGRFKAQHADTSTPDFALTLARQFDALTLRVFPGSRPAAARIYAHALRRHPDVARYLSWPRTLAMLLLGRRGRDRAAAWGRRHLPGLVD